MTGVLAKTWSPSRSARETESDGDGVSGHATRLLAWYDRHRRRLPWRALPGEHADPYAVWLSEIMLQQTTVAAVKPYFEKFLALWPSVAALAKAPVEEVMKAWAGLGYYSRARNLHACAKVVAGEHGGIFREPKLRCGGSPASVLIQRPRSLRSPSVSAPSWSTAMSSVS